MLGEILNSVGLILDIIGALMLTKYGLPPDIDSKGRKNIIGHGTDPEEIEMGKKI